MQIADYFCYRLNMPLAWMATFVLPFDTTLAQIVTFVLLFDTTLARVVMFVLPIDATLHVGGNVRATDWCHLQLRWKRSCYRLMPPLARVATFVLLFDTTLARVVTFVLPFGATFGSGSHVHATV